MLVGGELTVSASDKALVTHLTGVWTDTRAGGDMMGEKKLPALPRIGSKSLQSPVIHFTELAVL